MKVSIFTAAYNRVHTLPRLYESLRAQTSHDFEWIVVDDGSTDETQEYMTSLLECNTSDVGGGIK